MTATTEALIQKTPDIQGGDACIRGTRIPVWVLVGYRQLGWNDEKLFKNYPRLTADGLTAAWDYYRAFPEEIDKALRDNDTLDDGD